MKISPDRTNPVSLLGDITMMVLLHGRERTPAEFANLLLKEAGFSQPRTVRTTCPFSIVEATSV